MSRTAQMMLTLVMQGFAIGCVFNPMTVMAFTTLPAHLRGYADVVAGAVPQSRPGDGRVGDHGHVGARRGRSRMPTSRPASRRSTACCTRNDAASHLLDPTTRHGAAALDQMINHQAQIIAYNADFRMMSLVVVPPLLLLLVMRRHERPAPRPVAVPAAGD